MTTPDQTLPTITLRTRGEVMSELRFIWTELENYSCEIVANRGTWHRSKIVLEGLTLSEAMRLERDLLYWSDPDGGFDSDVRFRFRPFQRMAAVLHDHIERVLMPQREAQIDALIEEMSADQ